MPSWKDHFNAQNFWPTHHNPAIFIMSQWQPDKEVPNVIYLLIRVLIFVAFFVVWVLSYAMETQEGKHKWAIYLTNWGLTLCTIQSFFASLMLICSTFGNSDVTENVLKLYKTYWVINSMATTVAFTISLVYWTLIHQPEYMSPMNFLVHGMNSILMFIDFCVVAQPVRLLHFIYPIIITLAYVTMSAIYFACGGTAKNNDKYIYPILKWDEIPSTLGYCLAIMVVILVIHTATFLLYLLRNKISLLFFDETNEKGVLSDGGVTLTML
ncbi:hypothetical protein ABEB36_012006 [Hypothenemus hampei]|uniref:Protein rolling stone n=1 Tax=Hypothenemus hampei TaxID=57062 RepID=A0ABD1EA06_HYPHA